MAGTSWPGVQPVELTSFTSTYEYNAGGNPIYIGRAVPGTAKSDAGWQIQKLTWSGSNVVDIQFANASLLFNAIWDDRAGLSYS